MRKLATILCVGMCLVLGLAAQGLAETAPEAGFVYVTEGPAAAYKTYLPELKSMPLFQDIEAEALLALLDVMQPQIILVKAGGRIEEWDINNFLMVLKAVEPQEQEPRRFKWDMARGHEPGRMMWEIPSLSQFQKALGHSFKPPFRAARYDLYLLEMSGDKLTQFYNADVAGAQSIMLRNMLGMLSQKVMDTRRSFYILLDGFDIYASTE